MKRTFDNRKEYDKQMADEAVKRFDDAMWKILMRKYYAEQELQQGKS
jgi:hypothetical protein